APAKTAKTAEAGAVAEVDGESETPDEAEAEETAAPEAETPEEAAAEADGEAEVETPAVEGDPDGEAAALQADEPVDEPTADVVSPDPAARLAESGELHAAIEALLFTSPEPISALWL